MLSFVMMSFHFLLFVPSIVSFHSLHSQVSHSGPLSIRHLAKLPTSPISQVLSIRSKNERGTSTSLFMAPQQGQYTSFWGIFVTALQFAGPIFFLTLQLSSIFTAIEITKSKSCGPLSPLPFISLFTNSFVWSLYGLLKMDSTVFIPNSCGVMASLYCILAFHKHAQVKPNKLYIRKFRKTTYEIPVTIPAMPPLNFCIHSFFLQ